MNVAQAARYRHAPKHAHRALEALGASSGPIVVGPWLGEVGYELLYWIPFVAWAQRAYRLDPDRLIVLSRGGVRSWYAHLATRYLDIFDRLSVDEFREANQQRVQAQARPVQKQLDVAPLDREVLRRWADAIGEAPQVLHPSLMYRVLLSCRPRSLVDVGCADVQPFGPVPPHGLPLPDRYVAVRFYANSVFHATAENQAFVDAVVRRLVETDEVVVLDPAIVADDHRDFVIDHPRVHRLSGALTPATNLEVQTRVVAGAARFVGTYGGYAYLAPLVGVASTTYYTEQLAAMTRHLELAQRVFDGSGFGRLLATQVSHEVACV